MRKKEHDHSNLYNITFVTFLVNAKSTSASAFATELLARCNSSFKGTTESGSIVFPIPDPLPTNTI